MLMTVMTHTSQIPGDTLWHPAVEVSNSQMPAPQVQEDPQQLFMTFYFPITSPKESFRLLFLIATPPVKF